MIRGKRVVALGVAVAAALSSSSCASEPDAGKEALRAVRTLIKESNAGHGKAAAALLTDAAIKDIGYASRSEFVSGTNESPSALKLIRIVSIRKRSDDRAVITGDFITTPTRLVDVENRYSFTLTKSQRWRISAFAYQESPLRPETTALAVGAREYRFDVPAEVAPFSALTLQNNGLESHEVRIVRSDNRVSDEEAVGVINAYTEPQFENDEVDGFTSEFITWVVKPGEKKSVRFNRPLPAGEYFFICQHPQGSTEGAEPPSTAPTHAQLGMISKVVVQ